MAYLKQLGSWLRRHAKLVAGILLVLLILAALPFARGLSVDALLSYTPASLPLAALVLIAIYAAKSVLMFIPTYGLYIVGGLLFPPGWAILIGYAGLSIELSLGFLLGRWLGHDKVRALAQRSEKARKVIGYVDGNSHLVCFLTRLLPMPYPVDLGSMLFGASGMGFFSHLLFSLLGFSGVMIPITLAGGNLDDPLSARFIVPFAISIGLCTGLMLAYRVWHRRKMAAEAEAVAEPAVSEAPAGPHEPD